MTLPQLAILMWLFGRGRGSSASSSSPAPSSPAKPPEGPHDFAPISYAKPSPAGAPGGPNWVPYAPLNPQVIARATELLKDPTKVEVIEQDPAGPDGAMVRYLRTPNNPPGKTSVTAWRPRDRAALKPGGGTPGMMAMNRTRKRSPTARA